MSNARNLARLLPNTSGQLPDAAMSSGSVLQVVNVIDNTLIATAAESQGDIVSLTITPSSASSKILLIGSFSFGIQSGSVNASMHFGRTIGGTTTYPGRFTDGNRVGGVAGAEGNYAQQGENMCNLTGFYLDSPNTTSVITYKLRYAVYDTSAYIGRVQASNDSTWATRTYHQLYALEIAG